MVDLMSVEQKSREERFPFPSRQRFVRPKREEGCYNIDGLLDRNGWDSCRIIFRYGSSSIVQTLWHTLLGQFPFLEQFLPCLSFELQCIYLENGIGMQGFVAWLDLVTYLHHHGHDEKLPWYRGKVKSTNNGLQIHIY